MAELRESGRWGATLCVLLLAGVARGQEPGAPPDPDDLEQRADPIVVEAVRPGEIPEDPSSFTTVVDPRVFDGEAKTLEEMIGDTVGVQLRRFGGPGEPAELSIRGSTGSQVVVLLDGVRLNTAQSGTVDLSTIPRDLVERVEISRGGGSVQTGSDAIGGVVNIITRRPGTTREITAAGAGGSWSTAQGSFSVRDRIGGLEFSLGYDAFRTDGDFKFRPAKRVLADGTPLPRPSGTFRRVNNETENHSALLRLGHDLSEHLRLGFSDSFFHGDAGRPGPDDGIGPNLGQSLTAEQMRTRNVADLRLDVADVAGFDGDVRVFHRYDRSHFTDPDPALAAPPIDSDNRNHALGSRGELRRQLVWGPTDHRGALGVEYRRDWLDAESQANRDRDTVGVFFQDEVRLLEARLRLVPALRFDHTDDFGGEWIPRFGLVALPLPWLQLKGNVERSYRVPNFDELYFDEEFVRGNPNLDPEDALSADVGLEASVARVGPLSDAWFEVAGFWQDIDESIVFQLVSSNVVQATNTGDATVTGVEVGGGFRLYGWIGVSGNWTWLDTEQESTGNPLPGRPEHETFLRLEIGPPSRFFKIVAEQRYTDDIPVDSFGASIIQSRTVYDVGGSIDLLQLPWRYAELVPGKSLIFSVTANNVTDQSVRDVAFFPQPGRSFTFRVEGRW
ncbi:MAG: TonB-dependent receptor [Myxococcota bacterium]|nr:TonB-dependent receptor [Myxococcota bacterium]